MQKCFLSLREQIHFIRTRSTAIVSIVGYSIGIVEIATRTKANILKFLAYVSWGICEDCYEAYAPETRIFAKKLNT